MRLLPLLMVNYSFAKWGGIGVCVVAAAAAVQIAQFSRIPHANNSNSIGISRQHSCKAYAHG